MRLRDRMLTFIEAKTDVTSIVQSHFPEWVPDGLVLCPFHDDTKPSLHISPEGKAKCHSGGCDFSARNIIDLFARLEGLAYDEARWILYAEIVNSIPDSKVEVYQRQLQGRARIYVRTERHIPSEVIKEYRLGYDRNCGRITIPILDQFGVCINIRKALWDDVGLTDAKVISVKGYGEVRLFPENKMVHERKVLLVEGEWDALVGRSVGLPTVTWTGGAGSWNDDYGWLFKNKIVFVLYDSDEAGRKGAELVEDKLQKWADFVEVCQPLSEEGKDLTDWCVVAPTCVKVTREHIEGFGLPKVKKIKLCPYCGSVMK